MATLLRVLCQYTRADYAAIALADTKDPSSFRLVASGAYEKIAPRDLPLADEDAHAHCPANLMIKVALTGKASWINSSECIVLNFRLLQKPLPRRASGLIVSTATSGLGQRSVYRSRRRVDRQE
jgi:hypothetical protein